ncbi:MAG: two-component sensor histidine kinase [Planctomycetes bacterium]|nr:two-component sensor histidine kinase [Planctomycetota bacterium]
MSKPKHDNQRVIELSELAGGLAHEIRNPLSTLKVNLQLLAEDLSAESESNLRRRSLLRLETLQSETERLQILLDNFLKLVSGHEIHTQPVDVRNVVRHLVAFFTPRAEELDIRMRMLLSDQELICELDESLIQQALLNLCLNAQQAMPDGGELLVEATAEDEWARIDVTDTGIGIAAEELDKLFKPFFSTRKGGSGLGLSVTRRIVSEHEGTIEVQSELGKGSRFSVRLPRAQGRLKSI